MEAYANTLLKFASCPELVELEEALEELEEGLISEQVETGEWGEEDLLI